MTWKSAFERKIKIGAWLISSELSKARKCHMSVVSDWEHCEKNHFDTIRWTRSGDRIPNIKHWVSRRTNPTWNLSISDSNRHGHNYVHTSWQGAVILNFVASLSIITQVVDAISKCIGEIRKCIYAMPALPIVHFSSRWWFCCCRSWSLTRSRSVSWWRWSCESGEIRTWRVIRWIRKPTPVLLVLLLFLVLPLMMRLKRAIYRSKIDESRVNEALGWPL